MQVVVCSHSEQSLWLKAAALAERLQWPLAATIPEGATFVLWVENDHLAISLPTLPQFKPLYLNFAQGKHAYRLQHLAHEQLVKVCRVKGLNRPLRIIDATAGLGRDGLLLAASGAEVTLLEQVPVLACLLEDVLRRASPLPWRLDLHAIDALDYLLALSEAERPDVIYLDPMFDADPGKTALVKKELQILKAVVAPPDEGNQERLLQLARLQALAKVVVKRARLAKPLAGIEPHHRVVGSHSRFDVYLPFPPGGEP